MTCGIPVSNGQGKCQQSYSPVPCYHGRLRSNPQQIPAVDVIRTWRAGDRLMHQKAPNLRRSVSTQQQARYIILHALEIALSISGERSYAVLQGPKGRTKTDIDSKYQPNECDHRDKA